MLTVIGSAALDERLLVPHMPVAGDEFTVLVDGLSPGGKATNTAARAAALGVRTQLITRLGEDGSARIIRDCFRQVRKLSVLDAGTAARTPVATVLVTPDGERTILFRMPSGGSDPEPTASALAAARLGTVTWIDVRDPARRAAFHQAAEGTMRGLPVQRLRDGAAAGQSWELVVGSLADIPSRPDPELLAACGVQLCVLTDGSRGGFWRAASDADWRSFESAPAREVVDTAGAGDAFLGGLLAALARALPAQRALATAAWSGARAVEEPGAWPSAQALSDARYAPVSLWRKAGGARELG